MPTLTDNAIRLEDLPLWEMIPQSVLRTKRAELGRAFRSGYQQEAIDDSEFTFPSFEKCVLRGTDPDSMAPLYWPRYTGVDLSSVKRPGNVIVTIAMDPQTLLKVPVDVRYGSWTSPQMWRQIKDVYVTYAPTVIFVENNAYQSSIIEWGMEDARLPIHGFMTGKQKADPVLGLPSLEVEFANGAWAFCVPDDEEDCDCGWCTLVREFLSHPVHQTDDGVMASWFAREATRHGVAVPQDVQQGLFESSPSRWNRERRSGSRWRGRG